MTYKVERKWETSGDFYDKDDGWYFLFREPTGNWEGPKYAWYTELYVFFNMPYGWQVIDQGSICCHGNNFKNWEFA